GWGSSMRNRSCGALVRLGPHSPCWRQRSVLGPHRSLSKADRRDAGETVVPNAVSPRVGFGLASETAGQHGCVRRKLVVDAFRPRRRWFRLAVSTPPGLTSASGVPRLLDAGD